ncbi:MAG: ASKHA domain-containing protein [Actinomycetota bacterium]
MTGTNPQQGSGADDVAEAEAPSHTVVFTPSGLRGTVADGTTALEAARALGVDLDSVCGGRGICGRCQVIPGTGEFPKWALSVAEDHVTPPGTLEAEYRGKRPIRAGQRLGCGLRILGDAVFDVPAESQIHRQVVRKSVDLDGLTVDPLVTLHYVELAERHPEDGTSITVRIAEQLTTDWDLTGVTFDPAVLPAVHAAAAGPSDALTVALRAGRVIGVWPGFVDRAVGIAIDIGSTTVAGHLCDLTTGEVLTSAGRMNPQIRFGEDLMSRVSYVMLNEGGDDELTAAIRTALAELVAELLDGTGDQATDAEPLDTDRLLDIVLVGNPIMHHLALGIDPTPLGQSPFPLATDGPVETTAAALGIDAPWATVYVAPCIAGHVGADTAAAILSEGPHRDEAIQLLVDAGTNAEIVLGNRDRMFAASSPTGPAFEGAQISAGQRATAGAIERVRIDRQTLEPRFRVIGCELWSDEDGFEDATADTGVTGICGSGIIEVISELFLAGLIDAQGVIVGDGADRTPRIVPDERTFSYALTDRIHVTQADVRAIQLAKAALRAGIDLLLEHAELDRVDEIRLAGAFGAHIDPIHAMVLGLIPDCRPDRVRAVGNAAGSGAVRALLSADQRREMEAVVSRVTKIETATEPRFQELFVAALAFPHLTAKTTELSTVVDLPARPDRSAAAAGGRRRRSGGRRARPRSADEADPVAEAR